jgi:hypothetical protein
MIKNYSYTASEFFYDKGFKDYDQNHYVLTFNQPLANFSGRDIYCPSKVVLKEQLIILAYKPESNTHMLPLSDCIGIFDAMQDNVGVFGSHTFIDSKLGKLLKDTIGKDGLYKLAPIGDVLFDNLENPIEYILRGLYMRYK